MVTHVNELHMAKMDGIFTYSLLQLACYGVLVYIVLYNYRCKKPLLYYCY